MKARCSIAVATIVVVMGLAVPIAQAAITCTYSPQSQLLLITVGSNDSLTLDRSAAGAIRTNGSTCGNASVSNIEIIRIDSSGAGNASVGRR